MTIKNALGRLSWRFGKCKTINPVQDDIDALNCIIDTINELSIERIASNDNFTKLFIKIYQITLEHYKSNVYDDIPQKQIIKYLDKPVYNHFEKFTEFLNDSELFKVLDSDSPELKEFKEASKKYTVDEVRVEIAKTINKCLENLND